MSLLVTLAEISKSVFNHKNLFSGKNQEPSHNHKNFFATLTPYALRYTVDTSPVLSRGTRDRFYRVSFTSRHGKDIRCRVRMLRLDA